MVGCLLDLGDFAVDVLGRLKENNLQEQAVELIGALQANWSEYYAKEFYFFDSFLINRLLYLGESGELPGALRRFTDSPADGIDYLLPLFGSLVAYQYRDMAVEKVFPVLRSSAKVIDGAEYDFGLAVFADRLEKAYAARREGTDWPALNEAVEPFGFGIRPDVAKEIDTLWSGGFTVEALRAELGRDFGRELALLGSEFCQVMREQKGIGFDPYPLPSWVSTGRQAIPATGRWLIFVDTQHLLRIHKDDGEADIGTGHWYGAAPPRLRFVVPFPGIRTVREFLYQAWTVRMIYRPLIQTDPAFPGRPGSQRYTVTQ